MSTELDEVLAICRRTRGNTHDTGAHYLLGYIWAWLPDEKKQAIVEIFKEDTDENDVGNCTKCLSWCDSLESGICQTCIKEAENEQLCGAMRER